VCAHELNPSCTKFRLRLPTCLELRSPRTGRIPTVWRCEPEAPSWPWAASAAPTVDAQWALGYRGQMRPRSKVFIRATKEANRSAGRPRDRTRWLALTLVVTAGCREVAIHAAGESTGIGMNHCALAAEGLTLGLWADCQTIGELELQVFDVATTMAIAPKRKYDFQLGTSPRNLTVPVRQIPRETLWIGVRGSARCENGGPEARLEGYRCRLR
jgi:hypothetical protein